LNACERRSVLPHLPSPNDKLAGMHKTFTLRELLLFTFVVAVFSALRAYLFVVFLCVVAALHMLLLLVGTQLAKRCPQPPRTVRRRRMDLSWERRLAAFPWPVLVSIVYLEVFLFWQMVLFVGWRAPAIEDAWHWPTAAGFSLFAIHQAVLLALNVWLHVAFLAECYGSGRVYSVRSFATAAASALLGFAHLTSPVW
jgi:hypothetical protein